MHRIMELHHWSLFSSSSHSSVGSPTPLIPQTSTKSPSTLQATPAHSPHASLKSPNLSHYIIPIWQQLLLLNPYEVQTQTCTPDTTLKYSNNLRKWHDLTPPSIITLNLLTFHTILSQPNQFELQQTNQFSPKTTTQLTQTHTPDQFFI
jgi:hypothetical protein